VVARLRFTDSDDAREAVQGDAWWHQSCWRRQHSAGESWSCCDGTKLLTHAGAGHAGGSTFSRYVILWRLNAELLIHVGAMLAAQRSTGESCSL
jgi:hypothetical protein